ncbi:DUF3040 domain-containing protein [Nonomuraea lactucae]|uniref:DUF3040 domain-containing protein n=1 Tax=Nonomuraea lactucae TaxID=2249762 RepID=UPI000DE1ECF5|nr:DUF3040 domain-containing protein [Nonomuraea lactucae]
MTLSARERLVLKDIAHQIKAENPGLARSLTRLGTGPVTAERIAPSGRTPSGPAPSGPAREERVAHMRATDERDRQERVARERIPPAEYGRTVGLLAAGLAVLALAMLFTPAPNPAPRTSNRTSNRTSSRTSPRTSNRRRPL